jgi:hypothetical protein
MKKTKLFLSISGLCFALSVLVFGVFAATQVDYSISGQIIYEVTDAYVEVDTKIYASEIPAGFSATYDTAVALKSNAPNLSKLKLVEYDVSDIVDDFSYNSLNSNTSTCEFDDVALSGYYGYYFVITTKNLSRDVQVYMTANATSASSNVMVVSSGIVPSVTAGGSKIVVALMVEDATDAISTQDYTLTMKAGSVVGSSFTFEEGTTGKMTVSQKDGAIYSDVLVIPEQIDGVDVEGVGDFSGLSGIKEIYVPECIEYFEEHCFDNLRNLETLTVPYIGKTSDDAEVLGYFFTSEDPEDDDFYEANYGSIAKKTGGSESLDSYIPCSLKIVTVTNASTILGFDNGKKKRTWYGAFAGTQIDTVIVSSEVITSFDNCLFYGSEIKHVYIPSNVEYIQGSCFGDCTNLAKVDIPSSVQHIVPVYVGSSLCSFEDTPFLNSLYRNGMAIATAYDDNTVRWLLATDTNNLPTKITREMLNGVSQIHHGAFRGSDITEAYIPASVKEIGPDAFGYCSELSKVTIEGAVENIGYNAFEGCTSLQSIKFNEGLLTVGRQAFEGCTSLKSIYIPSTVTEIGEKIFKGCASLESITVPFIGKKNYSTINQMRTEECNGDTSDSSMDYATTFAWFFGDSEENGMVAVAGYKTYYVPSALRYVEVLEGCLNMFEYAFGDDNSACPITEIVIPSTIVKIDSCAFFGLKSLEKFTCKATTPPNTNGDAFSSCGSLKTIYVPDVDAYDVSPWNNFDLRQII